jgi:hypothetical protein
MPFPAEGSVSGRERGRKGDVVHLLHLFGQDSQQSSKRCTQGALRHTRLRYSTFKRTYPQAGA